MTAAVSNPTRLVVLISGSGSNLQAIIDAVFDDRISATVALVISNRPDAYGLFRAQNAGIPTEVIDHTQFADRAGFEKALGNQIDSVDADLIILAGFMRILSAGFVARYPDRILNIHPSLLPAFRGVDTHRRALEAGVTEHGASVHLVTAGLDEGPVIAQARVAVNAGDTAEQLAARVLEQEHLLYPDAIQQIIDDRVRACNGQLEFRDAD